MEEPIPTVPEPGSPADDLAGSWYWGNVPAELVPTMRGATIVFGENQTQVERIDDDVYRAVNGYWAGETLHVHRDPDGRPRHLEVVTFVLTRTPYDPKAPIPGAMPQPY